MRIIYRGYCAVVHFIRLGAEAIIFGLLDLHEALLAPWLDDPEDDAEA